MADILIYSSAFCGYCTAAKNFIKARGFDYREVRIDLDNEARQTMMNRTKRTSVPQIFINDTHVGGFDDMVALEKEGKLQALLEDVP